MQCNASNETLASGLVHRVAGDFAVQCTSLNRCAAVYAGGLHVTVWRAAGRCQLAAMVAAPQTYYGRTVGLMGLWSSNRSDDFLMSDSLLLTSPDLNAPSEEKLHLFGLSCEWKPSGGHHHACQGLAGLFSRAGFKERSVKY